MPRTFAGSCNRVRGWAGKEDKCPAGSHITYEMFPQNGEFCKEPQVPYRYLKPINSLE